MHHHLLKIALSTVTILLFSSALLAAECVNNVNSCTPKQLCEAATSTDSGKKVWTTEGLQRISEANLKHGRQTKDKLAAQRHAAKVGRRVMGELKRLEDQLDDCSLIKQKS